MKKFSAFLSEAERSFAAKEAEKLRLRGQYFPYLLKNFDCKICLLYTSPSPRDVEESRMPSSA